MSNQFFMNFNRIENLLTTSNLNSTRIKAVVNTICFAWASTVRANKNKKMFTPLEKTLPPFGIISADALIYQVLI